MWIRSQDKMNLVKVRQIGVNYQDNKQIIANYTPELYENSGGYYELLGTYKTKERALEVLNMIEDALIARCMIDIYGNDSALFNGISKENIMKTFNTTAVYDMPEK